MPKELILAKKQDLDKKWATFFYEVNIPFNVVQQLAFIEIVKVTFKSRTYYKPLSYDGSCIDLLNQSKADVSKQIIERTLNLTHKYGATIYFDGWDNVARCPLLNVMLTCSNGDVFIGSIDTIEE